MELLEVILASVDWCGCFMYLWAGSVDVATLICGSRTFRRARDIKAGRAPIPSKINAILFWLFLPFAIFMTGLVIWTWFLWLRRE